MIDIEGRMMRAMQGEVLDFTVETPEGMDHANQMVNALLDELPIALGVDPARIVLGGFSQGGMLSLDVALRGDRPLAALLLMSPTYLCVHDWLPRMNARSGLPVLLSHGSRDPLLPFPTTQRLRDDLRKARVDVHWVEFPGGHEIRPEVLRGASEVLALGLGGAGVP